MRSVERARAGLFTAELARSALREGDMGADRAGAMTVFFLKKRIVRWRYLIVSGIV